MKIVIIGQGAIGLLFYHRLTLLNQHQVTLACSKRVKIAPEQYQFTALDGQCVTGNIAIASNQDIQQAELVIFCVKSYQLASALAQIQTQLSPEARLVLAHNGMGAIEDYKIIKQTCISLLITHGCKQIAPFNIQYTGAGHIDLGIVSGHLEENEKTQLITLFKQALGSSEFHHNIVHKQWLKLAINCVINPITAVENINNGLITETKYSALYRQIIDEVVAVAKAEGITLDNANLQTVIANVAHNTANNCSSMRSDILAKRLTEIDYINGFIVKQAKKHGIAVPANKRLYQQVVSLSKTQAN